MAETKTKKAKSSRKSSRAKSGPRAASKNGSSSGARRSANGTGSRARLPLVAGGAALVGAASGVAFSAARSGTRVLGVTLPHRRRVQIRSKDLANAAKEVGRFGDQVGDLTGELRSLREGVGKDGPRNSPLEVLLRGLTTRR